jgi:hypothetical protein
LAFSIEIANVESPDTKPDIQLGSGIAIFSGSIKGLVIGFIELNSDFISVFKPLFK